MKLTISVCRKVGQPNYGSEGATCGLELDVDQSALDRPEVLADRVRSVYGQLDRLVEDQLHRATSPLPAPPAREDFRSGDPGYDRQYAPPPASAPPAPAPPPPAPTPPAVDPRTDLPTTGRQFAGWLAKRSDRDKGRVQALTRAWNLGSMYRDWDADSVKAVVYELLQPAPPPAPTPPAVLTPAVPSVHEAYLERRDQKRKEEQIVAQAWAAGADRNGAPTGNGYVSHR